MASNLSIRLRLRPVPPVGDLPDEPYPLLDPYTHPATFGGREREIAELVRLLRRPPLILCVHAPSGAGKSSLLKAGLVPELRRSGVPVCLLRDSGEPLLAQRLVAGVLDVPTNFAIPDDTPGLYRQFADWMFHAQSLAGKPPVLILDQLDDILGLGGRRDEAWARLGPLMAATAQRLHGETDYCCRWVLAYRGEFHHDLDVWLRDVLTQAEVAKRTITDLPRNLRGPDVFDSWPIPMLGASLPGSAMGDLVRDAFLAAINRPLTLESSPGRKRYAVRFGEQGAERLAEAFEESRKRDPRASLAPELQAVLRYLIDSAPEIDGVRVLEVSRDPDELQRQIQDALAEHLRRALERAFPYPKHERFRDGVRTARSEALVVLSELTDEQGRCLGDLAEERFLHALPSRETGTSGGLDVLSTLASPRIRLIVRDDNGRYRLSHDSMAKVVRTFVEQERAHGNLELDLKVLDLHHFVTQRSGFFSRFPHDESTLVLSREQYSRIQELADSLLLDEKRHRWWEACRRYRRQQRGRRRVRASLALVTLVLLGAGVVYLYAERAEALRNRTTCGSERFDASALCLPNDKMLGFVSIDGGEFLMGSHKGRDSDAAEDEIWNGEPAGLGRLHLPTFLIAKFEMTVAQFRACLDSKGCNIEDASGLGQSPDHPIASVTWREAMTYCRWLEKRLRESRRTPHTLRQLLNQGWRIQLPTEAQWEKAARGSDGRIYPWGNDVKSGRANYRAPNTRSVGTFTCPECPYQDLVDMIGNVHEWSRSLYKNYPYDPLDGRNDVSSHDARVIRGGAYPDKYPCRVARRYRGDPNYQNIDLGFRVVLSSF